MTVPAPSEHPLRAVSLPLSPGAPIDPYRLCGDDGVLFASPELVLVGLGSARSIPLPEGLGDAARLGGAATALCHIECDDRVGRRGSGVVALGALPFDPSEKASLVVPALTYGRDGAGGEWVTVVAQDPPARFARETLLERSDRSVEPAGPVTGVALQPSAESWSYPEAVAEAVAAIVAGSLRKVVLARRIQLVLPEGLSSSAVLGRLHRQEPLGTSFSFPVDGGRFIGASPELLVSRCGDRVRCHPLAGTVGLGEAGQPDAVATGWLLRSAKDREEHRLVVDDVAALLAPRCRTLDVPAEPSLVRLATIAHLGTQVEGTLAAESGTRPGVLDLVALLHPTPAVGGVPRADALGLIEKLEPASRGHWAGPVGWAGADGDGDWWIGIRSATLGPHGAHLWAGAGIVAGSEPQAELTETTLKLRPVLEAIAPGASRLLSA